MGTSQSVLALSSDPHDTWRQEVQKGPLGFADSQVKCGESPGQYKALKSPGPWTPKRISNAAYNSCSHVFTCHPGTVPQGRLDYDRLAWKHLPGRSPQINTSIALVLTRLLWVMSPGQLKQRGLFLDSTWSRDRCCPTGNGLDPHVRPKIPGT